MSQTARTSDESIEELEARVKPLVDAIDLTLLSKETLSVIAIAELSGTDLPDAAKKLLCVEKKGLITSDEYKRIVIEGTLTD